MNDPAQPNDRRALLQDALQAVQKMQAKLDAIERANTEPIAIIGLGCRFPGGANNPESYWKLLSDGIDAVTEVPASRWSKTEYLGPDLALAEKEAPWYGGFLDQVDTFDPAFFGISPREANSLDPQQRLVLEVSWEALERAGQPPDELGGSLTGVFLGITTNDYAQIAKLGGPSQMDVYTATGTALNAAAGRVAYTLGLQGPCMAIDTACSSSLVAVHLACQSLRSRESNLALVGGVNVLLTPEPFVCFAKWGMMAPDGRCKTFDAKADGFVRGEGCGMIVLKRLSDALNSGDNILATIRGSAVNQDGRSSGLTVPNGLAQQVVVRNALAIAGVKPVEVSYVETHGTGTSLGDPIEVEALGAALAEGRGTTEALLIGSVKTNIGHLESASGIAGLIKVVLSLQHGEIPPHLHFEEPSPRIPWPEFPMVIPKVKTPWPPSAVRRIAGVSSFGFSGTNAHVILEEAPAPLARPNEFQRPASLLVLSAKGDPPLQELAQRFAQKLDADPSLSLADLCYTASTGRAHFPHRLALVATSTRELQDKLATFLKGESVPGLRQGDVRSTVPPKVAFLFTGQGSQYPGMAKQLFATQPVFRQTLEECDRLLQPYLPLPLLSVLFPEPGNPSPIDQTQFTQPALFALEYALAQMWRSWGIQPSLVLGHSVGEYVAACLAGVFSLPDALRLIVERGRLMQALPLNGGMAAVNAPYERVMEAIRPFPQALAIAAVNGPDNLVVSGEAAALEAVLREWEREGVKARRLKVSHAFHSPLMDPMLEAFREVARGIEYQEPQIRLVGNRQGEVVERGEVTNAEYWVGHVREAVQFGRSIETLQRQGVGVYLEVGPGTTLLGMGKGSVPEGEGGWLPSLRPGQEDWPQVLSSLGGLYVAGVAVDWEGFEEGYAHHKLPLPTYPFQRKRYWVAATAPRLETLRTGHPQSGRDQHPLLGSRLDLAHSADTYVWEGTIDLERLPYLTDHRVQDVAVLPATAYAEMAMAAAAEVLGAGTLELSEIQYQKPLFLTEGVAHRIQITVKRDALDAAGIFQIHSRPAAANQPRGLKSAWILLASGKVGHGGAKEELPTLAPDDLAAIKARCAEEIEGKLFYQQLEAKGNQWGLCFRGVERIWRGAGEALSLVVVPESIAPDLESYQFHPALADACGHVLVAALPLQKSEDPMGGAFVGGGIEAARLYQRPMSRQLWAYARVRPDADEATNVLIGDVKVFDESGTLVTETLGAHLWYLDEHEQPTAKESLEDWFYELRWQAKALPERPRSPSLAVASIGHWLILADRLGVGKALAEALKTQGEKCSLAYVGGQYESIGENRYRLRPKAGEDFSRLLVELESTDKNALRGIIHLWSLDASLGEELTVSTLEAAQTLGCASALHLIQAVAGRDRPNAPRIRLVTQGAHSISGDRRPVAVAQAPLWGLGRALAVEHGGLWGGLIDLDQEANTEAAAAFLIQELLEPDGEDQIALRQGQRFVARLMPHNETPSAPSLIAWRTDATYLIAGGLGGLGLRIARWMVEGGARHLILMGRTGLPPRSQWDGITNHLDESRLARQVTAIRELEGLGARIYVAAVDVAELTEVQAFLDKFGCEELPPIRGVIHAAGVLQHHSLIEQDAAGLWATLRPKMLGGWLLHELLDDAPLDFFAMFSSASAVLSSPFLGAYAAANSFLDALAHFRRAKGKPALSINWGVWADEGMTAQFDRDDVATIALRGMGTIPPSKGLEALGTLLQQESPQVAVLPVNWRRWQDRYPAFVGAPLLEHLVDRTDLPGEGSRPVLTRDDLLKATPAERERLVRHYLGEQLTRVLELASSDLEGEQPLSDFGLDSLMAVELRNRIESDLGVPLSVVTFLQGPNLGQLTALVLDRFTLSLQSSTGETADVAGNEGELVPEQANDAVEVERLLANLDLMTDEKVDSLLAKLLSGEELLER